MFIIIIIIYHVYAVFTIICLKQTTAFLQCVYCCGHCVVTVCTSSNVISHVKYITYIYSSTSYSKCAVPNVAVLCSSFIVCVVPGVA